MVLIKAGELDRTITFQRATITPDALNEPIRTWADACTVWASVAEVGSKELYQAQKLYSETSAVFKIRYTQKVNSRMRIKLGTRIFEILGVTPDRKRTALTISTKEVV